MFKNGCLRKIEVKNFVTYSHVELYPGPNLNMIIGPNGTGKSTMVAAIILGLGGNPKVVGRGHKISEYIKHNCDSATIHVSLQGDSEKEIIKITRIFTKKDKSTWCINNQQSSINDVLDCVKKYNIQVDNLCQFLPQDRVQNFAKMNQQQLLKETQMALCRNDLLDKQQTLIVNRETHKKLLSSIEKYGDNLKESQHANLKLEGRVQNFVKMKQYINGIQDIERKVAWVQFDEAHSKLEDVKLDAEKATEIYQKLKNTAGPMEKEILDGKQSIKKQEQTKFHIERQLRETKTSLRTKLESSDDIRYNVAEIKSDLSTSLALIDQKRKEIQSIEAKIEEMRATHKKLINTCENDVQVQEKCQRLSSDIQKLQKHVSTLEDQKEELSHRRRNATAQLRLHEREIAQVEDVKQRALENLRNMDAQAYEATMWLKNNRHLFKGQVFDPIILELNVLDPAKAKYVENVIPVRDFVAFTCVEKEDVNLLIRHLRDGKQLVINVLHSGNTGERLADFRPALPIEQLRQFGLYTYLVSLFTAPDPIMRYLCRTYRVHDIPVGDATTDNFYDAIPNKIRVFFSATQRYGVTFSKYTGAKSIMQNEIRAGRQLSVSVDVLKLDRLKGLVNELQNQMENSDRQMREFDTQIHKVNDKIGQHNEELKTIRNAKMQARTILDRIKYMETQAEEIRQDSNRVNQLQSDARLKIQKTVQKLGPLHEKMLEELRKISDFISRDTLQSVKMEKIRKEVALAENKFEETRQRLRESEITMNQVKEAMANVKGQAKAALKKAKGLSSNFTPEDEGFEQFRQSYERLSSDITKLLDEKDQVQAKIDCLPTANDREIREYEERVRTIEGLQDSIDRSEVELTRITTTMDQLEEEWLVPLNEIIAEIGNGFSAAFEKMGCAGEVGLNKGANEKDYGSYGLSIKVTYRNGEPLQELNNVVQSGGERAVATAVFMMSLQQLTPVPFRCVDEINQGMDANNERRIFELLVNCTDQPNTSQYFLITPKLVPNLKYSRFQRIHIIHNGPFVEADKKWAMNKLCNPQKVPF